MSEGFMWGSDLADWWEEANENRQADLEAFVTKHPTWWGVTLAAGGGTALDVWDMFFVDLLRLGEGAAQGTVKGFMQDIFRVMSVIPQAKVMKGAKAIPAAVGKVVQTRQLGRLWRTVQGELCVPISIAQAMQRSGQKLAVGLKEIADSLGQPLIDIYRHGQNSWPAIGPALTRLGIKFKAFSSASMKFDDVVNKAATADGPLLVRLTSKNKQGIEAAGHAVLVARTRSGVQIIDRTGFVRNLDELSQRYNLVDDFVVDDTMPIYEITNAVVDDSLITLVKEFGALASLARVSIGIFDFNYHEVTADFVKEQFEKFVGERHSGEPGSPGQPMHVVNGKTVTVKAGDPNLSTLSGIAKAEYGDFNLWPLIYDLNKDKIGPNPNRLKPNTQLFLLPLDQYDAQEIAAAKRRAPSWKNYR